MCVLAEQKTRLEASLDALDVFYSTVDKDMARNPESRDALGKAMKGIWKKVGHLSLHSSLSISLDPSRAYATR